MTFRFLHLGNRHPEIDVRLSTNYDTTDFVREDIDMGIRYGRGPWSRLHSVLPMTEEMFPVCSPDLLKGCHPLRKPADLVHHSLIHDTEPPHPTCNIPDWRTWLEAAGETAVDPMRGPGFLDGSMARRSSSGQPCLLRRGPTGPTTYMSLLGYSRQFGRPTATPAIHLRAEAGARFYGWTTPR